MIGAKFRGDLHRFHNIPRPGPADAENILKGDFHPLLAWYINACNACHS
jgi:hypothetical protein